VRTAHAIQSDISATFGPPEEGLRASNLNSVVPMVLFRNSRGYLIKVANQANGAYSQGWFDASAVMVRRLLETLIIEAFEKNGISHEIKNVNGDFLYLRDLISKTLSCSSWNLSRNTKQALPKLKDVGDKSAHSRRYNAIRDDLDSIKSDLRCVTEELLFLAGLR
jgi:hypothetical protein